jgi:hypothetical protein
MEIQHTREPAGKPAGRQAARALSYFSQQRKSRVERTKKVRKKLVTPLHSSTAIVDLLDTLSVQERSADLLGNTYCSNTTR